MANYVVDPTDPTHPLNSQFPRQGAEECRALKGLIQTILGTIINWNPLDKSASIALSGGNLIAVKNNVDLLYHAVRANVSLASGKIYWEITINSAAVPKPIFGIGTINAGLETYVGGDTFGFGYGGDLGNRFNNGAGVAFGVAPAQGDVIGFALDLTVPQLQIFKNNVSQGIIAITAGKAWLPIASMQVNGEQNTVNFGAQPFAFSPPAGFTSPNTVAATVPVTFVKQFFPTF